MANPNTLIQTNLSNGQKSPAKVLINLKETLIEQTTSSTQNRRKKNTTATTLDSTKQDARKMIHKVQIIKKENSKDKNKITKTNTGQTNESKKKSFDNNYNTEVSNVNNEILVKNKSQSNKNSSKILSPNHKLTEYFSHLKVNESSEDFNNQQESQKSKKNLRKAQENKTNEYINECIRQDDICYSQSLQINALLQTPEKKLFQCKDKSKIDVTNHKVTEYFHIRRSQRNYEKHIINEKQKDIENKILSESQEGLMIKEFESKGRGIITTKEFHKGDFVIEYIGDLIDGSTAKHREMQYAKNKNIGCYMYFFKHKNKQYCIDATEESNKLGRLINHSRKGNLISKIIEINKIPRLVLFAKSDIPTGAEILYDYGDRSQESVRNHPWLSF